MLGLEVVVQAPSAIREAEKISPKRGKERGGSSSPRGAFFAGRAERALRIARSSASPSHGYRLGIMASPTSWGESGCKNEPGVVWLFV